MNTYSITIRKAGIHDIPALLDLINGFAAEGIMLPRTEFEMSENIRDFAVAYDGAELAGCAALHIYTPTMAEVRSLAVSRAAQHKGIGRLLMREMEREARELGLHSLFAFTYVDGFFDRMGYELADRGELPLKVWRDCIKCNKFTNCDEIAVVKHLVDVPLPAFNFSEFDLLELVQIEVPAMRK